MSMDRAAEDADERSPWLVLLAGCFLVEGGFLALKKLSRAVVEEDEGIWPRLERVGLLRRNSRERLRISNRDEMEDCEINA